MYERRTRGGQKLESHSRVRLDLFAESHFGYNKAKAQKTRTCLDLHAKGRSGKVGVSALTGVAAGFTVKRMMMIVFSVLGIVFVSVLFMAVEGWMSVAWGHT